MGQRAAQARQVLLVTSDLQACRECQESVVSLGLLDLKGTGEPWVRKDQREHLEMMVHEDFLVL